MAEDRTDPSTEVPEADLAEQQTPQSPVDAEQVANGGDADPGLSDEADRLEQRASLTGTDEDDYPRESSESGTP